MAENAATMTAPPATRTRPPIPPREPEGLADWRVTCRHSPLFTKMRIVKAKGREEAWKKYIIEAEAELVEKKDIWDKRDPKRIPSCRTFLAEAKKELPLGTEIIGAEYYKARLNALRIKGTLTVDQIGFPELASA